MKLRLCDNSRILPHRYELDVFAAIASVNGGRLIPSSNILIAVAYVILIVQDMNFHLLKFRYCSFAA